MKTMVMVIAGALLGIVTTENAARADPTKKEDSYGYVFTDDALKAEGKDVLTAQIRVRPRGTREALLRPRVHFVTEMLKTVENL